MIFSKIKQLLGKELRLMDKEVLNFLLSYSFFFSQEVNNQGQKFRLNSVFDLRQTKNPSQIRDGKWSTSY